MPPWVPWDENVTVLAAGAVEISLGLASITQRRRQREVGAVADASITAIVPGNVAHLTEPRDAFGRDTDTKCAVRLPVLVGWAWWSKRNT